MDDDGWSESAYLMRLLMSDLCISNMNVLRDSSQVMFVLSRALKN